MFAIIDVETTGLNPAGEKITEIAVYLHDGNKITGEYQTLLNPEKRIPHQITGLTEERLKDVAPLDEAFNRLVKVYPFSSAGWAAWGEGDRRRVVSECAAKSIPYPFADSYLNVSQLHNLFMRNTRRVSLEEALEQFDMKFEGRPHSGADDAWNTARVLKRILESSVIAE